jgi:hypothetical protein
MSPLEYIYWPAPTASILNPCINWLDSYDVSKEFSVSCLFVTSGLVSFRSAFLRSFHLLKRDLYWRFLTQEFVNVLRFPRWYEQTYPA